MNKRNSLSADIVTPLLVGEVGLEYKNSVTSVTAFTLSYKRIFADGSADTLLIDEYKGFQWVETEYIGTYRARGGLWGVAALHGGGGLPMPLGYYSGLGFDHWSIKVVETYEGDSIDPISYRHKGNRIKIIWGKDTYVGGNFSVDFRIEYGVKWGKLKGLDDYSKTKSLSNIAPYKRGPLSASEDPNYFNLYGTVKLKLAYLF